MPEEFEPYRIISVLGQGGMGVVYLVEDARQGRRGVMKVGVPNLDSQARERFTREATALQQLRHPNIPALFDFGALSGGRPFLVTEWVEGSDLAKLIASGTSFSLRDVLLLARAVARALGCAHEHQIVHLDVKPANIIVPAGESDGYRFEDAKLADFSVLGNLEVRTGSTRAGMVVGTPYYMSPEQVRGEALTPSTDIFALGVVMYEMLSGRRPFEGETAQEMFFALLSSEPEPLRAPIPSEVADIVRWCIDKDPRRRPRSGNEMALLVERLIQAAPFDGPESYAQRRRANAEPSKVSPDDERLITQAPVQSAPVAAVPAPHSAPHQTASRRMNPVALISTAVLVVVVIIGTVLAVKGRVPHEFGLIALGGLLVVGGVAMGLAARKYLAGRRDLLSVDVSEALKGAKTRKALSMTLSLQVDEVVRKCRLMDEKFLGLTMALMVKEYDSARNFDDRQKALMNAIAILDKLEPKLSPWYIRHEKLVATGVSLVGIISGLVTVAQSVVKLIKQAP